MSSRSGDTTAPAGPGMERALRAFPWEGMRVCVLCTRCTACNTLLSATASGRCACQMDVAAPDTAEARGRRLIKTAAYSDGATYTREHLTAVLLERAVGNRRDDPRRQLLEQAREGKVPLQVCCSCHTQASPNGVLEKKLRDLAKSSTGSASKAAAAQRRGGGAGGRGGGPAGAVDGERSDSDDSDDLPPVPLAAAAVGGGGAAAAAAPPRVIDVTVHVLGGSGPGSTVDAYLVGFALCHER